MVAPEPSRLSPRSSGPSNYSGNNKDHTTSKSVTKRAEPEVQDGRYGFEAQEEEMDVEMNDDRDKREIVLDTDNYRPEPRPESRPEPRPEPRPERQDNRHYDFRRDDGRSGYGYRRDDHRGD